ncbi:MAG: nuclear transport factor 2 family protein [Candidatus Dormibacteraeota bacterium]|nr:nuclear transport factor 2 family protein [Candidatus Dormibacteraeota bacterium]
MEVAREFLRALEARDFDHLAACLAPQVRLRMLLPRGLDERRGRIDARRTFEGWFGECAELESRRSELEEVCGRWRLAWAFQLRREGRGREVIEQVAFCDASAEGIDRIDLLCSGFMPLPVSEPSGAHTFDAGRLGCADGLAQAFRQRIHSIPVGDSLAVIVGDPAAREDLPSLARMLGHAVKSAEAQPDGRLTITVERCK